jgi:putative membrane protein
MQAENLQLAKKLKIGAWVVTGIVLVFVSIMHKITLDVGIDFSFLPPLYSFFNALTGIVLIAALYQIKQKNIQAHQRLMNVAVVFSGLFLLGYVIYHLTNPDTIFGDANHDGVLDDAERLEVAGIRTFYLVILIAHIVLAAIILPFILFTYIRAYTHQIAKHKKMARWVFPLWLFVALSGPFLYWMIAPYYK